jgi:RHS repeat-associated protein
VKPTTTQHFAQDGWNPAKPTPIGTENFDVWADLTETNELETRYLRGDVVDEIVARIDDNGSAWLLTDYQGSVRDVTDAAGNVIASRDYEAFGLISAESGAEWFGRYGNAGREWDAELGMYHNRRREFDPLTGRFTSEDPFGLGPDTNPFRYVGNSPTNYTDPSGNDKEWVNETLGYTTKEGKNKRGILIARTGESTTAEKKTIIITFETKDDDLLANVNYLQFIKRSVFKDGKEYSYKKGERMSGYTSYDDAREFTHFFGEQFHVDTLGKDPKNPYYIIEAKNRKKNFVGMSDQPGDLAPPTMDFKEYKGYDEVRAFVETYLVIDDKVFFRVEWVMVEKFVDGKWKPGFIENVKGTKVTKLPDFAQGKEKLFGGYIVNDKNEITSDIYYHNQIK